jgi:hypothetical protein
LDFSRRTKSLQESEAEKRLTVQKEVEFAGETVKYAFVCDSLDTFQTFLISMILGLSASSAHYRITCLIRSGCRQL